MQKRICVYKITNPKKRVYIGSTLNFKRRMAQYEKMDCVNQSKLYRSIKKYGFDKHKIEIICDCDIVDIRQKEAYYGQLYNCLGENGLNCYLPKHDGFISVGKETRNKMSIAATKRGPISEELRQKFSNLSKGRKMSEEAKKKISASNKILHPLPPSTNILLNTLTGIYYYGVREAAKSLGVKYTTFYYQLRQGYTDFIVT